MANVEIRVLVVDRDLGTVAKGNMRASLRYHGTEAGNSSMGAGNITRYVATVTGDDGEIHEIHAYDRDGADEIVAKIDSSHPLAATVCRLSAEADRREREELEELRFRQQCADERRWGRSR